MRNEKHSTNSGSRNMVSLHAKNRDTLLAGTQLNQPQPSGYSEKIARKNDETNGWRTIKQRIIGSIRFLYIREFLTNVADQTSVLYAMGYGSLVVGRNVMLRAWCDEGFGYR